MPNSQNAHDWISSKIKKLESEGNSKQLASLLTALCSALASEEIHRVFKSEMEVDGYFEQVRNSKKGNEAFTLDPYTTLGVTPTDDANTIEKAVAYLTMQFRPTEHMKDGHLFEAIRRYQAVYTAGRILGDKRMRGKYDNQTPAVKAQIAKDQAARERIESEQAAREQAELDQAGNLAADKRRFQQSVFEFAFEAEMRSYIGVEQFARSNKKLLPNWTSGGSHNDGFHPEVGPKLMPEYKGDYEVGLLVHHEIYGVGRITEISGQGASRALTIRFSIGERKLMAAKAKLAFVQPE